MNTTGFSKPRNSRSSFSAAAGLALGLTAATAAQANQPYSTIQAFSTTDGANPSGATLAYAPGVLLGVTQYGGLTGNWGGTAGNGTVYRLKAPASPNGTWAKTVIYNFHGLPADGANPLGGLVGDAAGNVYGTTTGAGKYTCGTVFKLTPSSPWPFKLSTIHHFDCTHGADPLSKLLVGPGGVLYGTTRYGGPFNAGMAFELVPPTTPTGPWGYVALHYFGKGQDGIAPYSGFVEDGAGTLYGTTANGGWFGNGIIYKLLPPNESVPHWTYAILHHLNGTSSGGVSLSTLALDAQGSLFGTAAAGGANGGGVVFRLSPPTSPGGLWKETVLHSFTTAEGSYPVAGVLMGGGGVLFGSTAAGASGAGAIFSLTPPVSPQTKWTFSSLHVFQGTDGYDSYADFTWDPSFKAFYGVNYGGGPGAPQNVGTVYKYSF